MYPSEKGLAIFMSCGTGAFDVYLMRGKELTMDLFCPQATLHSGHGMFAHARASEKVLYEKAFILKLSGNEVYNTACSLLVILKNSCSELHCQRVLT